MKTTKRFISLATAAIVAVTLLAASAVSSFAAAPAVRKVEYKGKGIVELEFRTDVNYKNVKVIVKNAAGKACKVKLLERDDDELKFKVTGLKSGKAYSYTVKGVRREHTGTFGNVSGKFKVPAAKISLKAAKSKAISNAVSKYHIKKATVRDCSAEVDTWRGRSVWEVEFEGCKSNGRCYELEYRIDRSTGKVLTRHCEYDH